MQNISRTSRRKDSLNGPGVSHLFTLLMVAVLFVFALLAISWRANAQQHDYPIQTVPFTQVKFSDKFWLPRIRTNHEVTIPASFGRCEAIGRVGNFEMNRRGAAGAG